MYTFFIIFIYVVLSLPFHFLDSLDPEILNTISTNVFLNLIFFVVFVFFALSFFGFYDLTLPVQWADKSDKASISSGIIGVFFMALTLAIVSFSCTGPILGSLLAGSLTADGGATQLSIGMLGFGIALGMPFGLFALFPNTLKALPKSGNWMTNIKVILGFLELALALKFLSNADLVAHFGLLKRTTKKNRVEIFRVTSGERKTKNSLDFLDKALYNIQNKRYIKNRLSCKYCPFHGTEHCS